MVLPVDLRVWLRDAKGGLENMGLIGRIVGDCANGERVLEYPEHVFRARIVEARGLVRYTCHDSDGAGGGVGRTGRLGAREGKWDARWEGMGTTGGTQRFCMWPLK